MDAYKELAAKKPEDVVLVIPVESTAAENSSNQPGNEARLESLQGAHNAKPKTPSPEISKSAGMSPKKVPRPAQPEALFRRRSITRPKSRFEEPLNPSDSSCALTHDHSSSSPYKESPNQKASGTPKTPRSNNDEEEEEEDDEVYKKELLQKTGKRRKKWKIWLLIEWVMLILATACLITSLLVQRLQEHVIWGLEIWKWCLMVMVIFCGQLMTHWFITVLVFLIEINFLFRKKVLYFVYGLQKSVQFCVWLGLILLSWSLIFNDSDVPRSPKTAKALNYVSRILASLLIGSVIWLVKTLLVKVLASSFHMNRFFDRIQETLYHQYLLQALSGPPLIEMAEKVGPSKSSSQFSFLNIVKSTGKGKGEKLEVIDIAKLHRISQEKVSAWTMRGLVNVIRSSGLSTISNKIDESFDEDKSLQKDKEITNEAEARAAARQIFKTVAKPGHKFRIPSQLFIDSFVQFLF